MALAAVVGAVSGMALGRLIDAGHGTRAVWIALGAVTVSIALRAMSYGNAPFAVIANAGGALVGCLYAPAMGTAIYNQAKRSPCALRFHIAAEGGWDIGGAGAALVAAGLLASGMPLGAGILLSFLGVPALLVLLRRYYETPNPQGEPLLTSELAGR